MKQLTLKSLLLKGLLLFIFFTTQFTVFPQPQKPFKTGLVLSGGGAKGLAHIGLLQLIDSLEIQIDYITGTSMGAILSGFYSVGYSADSIHNIINELKWEYALTNNIPLTRVHINEKKDFYKYLVSLPVKNHRPSLPGSFVEGQYLSETLGNYLFSTRNITNFHELPIPLEIIAADIITGKKVVMKNGSLPMAIRASMAIPAFFTPVDFENFLLVDGGWKRNFPVEEVKNLGADFVIGSYTGFRKMSEKEIDNAMNTVYQLFALDAVEDAEKMKAQTDILLDFSTTLRNYSTQSFDDYKEIIKIGKQEARKLLPQLTELKKKQTEAGILFERKKITPQYIPVTQTNTFLSSGQQLSEKERKNVLAIFNSPYIEDLDSLNYVNERINLLFSHLNYTKIFYTYDTQNDKEKSLNLYFKKSPPSLQLALHYDTHESAGIVLRYINRNFLKENNRLEVGMDLSEYFKINASYLKYLNSAKNTWAKIQYDYRRQKGNDLFFKLVSQIMFFTDPTIYNSYHNISLSAGFSPDISSCISTGIEHKHNKFNKSVGAVAKSIQTVRDSSRVQSLYKHNHLSLFLKYNRNTLNSNLFPTRGNELEIGSRIFFNNHLKIAPPNIEDQVATEFHAMLNPQHYKDSISAQNPVLQLWINEKALIPLTQNISLRLQAFAGMNFSIGNQGLRAKEIDDYMFLSQKFNLGGYHNYSFDRQIPFPGLSLNELKINNVVAFTIGAQWNVWKKLYITPNMGIAFSPTDLSDDNAQLNNILSSIGAGLDLDYQSFVGPLKLSVNYPWFNSGVFFSLGYQF